MAVWRYDVFVREAFQESKDFQMAQKQAFEGCVNKDTRTAQYLSLYIDDLFRSRVEDRTKMVDTYTTCATDTGNIKVVFDAVTDIIVGGFMGDFLG